MLMSLRSISEVEPAEVEAEAEVALVSQVVKAAMVVDITRRSLLALIASRLVKSILLKLEGEEAVEVVAVVADFP